MRGFAFRFSSLTLLGVIAKPWITEIVSQMEPTLILSPFQGSLRNLDQISMNICFVSLIAPPIQGQGLTSELIKQVLTGSVFSMKSAIAKTSRSANSDSGLSFETLSNAIAWSGSNDFTFILVFKNL